VPVLAVSVPAQVALAADPPAAEPDRPAASTVPDAESSDPKVWLTAVMLSATTDPRLRMDAAKALLPFVHAKIGEGGKKDQQKDAAKKAASKFVAATPPKLAAAGGRTL
jgi:phage terminase small subunit